MEPVPVVRIRRQMKAAKPAGFVNAFILRSIIIHRYTATTARKPVYRMMFQAKIDLKL